jgi:predicted nucleic acid-binding protein
VPALAYIDSSAILKLVVVEPETTALRRVVRTYDAAASSVLSRVEVERVIRRIDSRFLARARSILQPLDMVSVTEDVLDAAARLEPAQLRTLDAVHLATATLLGSRIDTFITYDRRQATAAEAAGFVVASPS